MIGFSYTVNTKLMFCFGIAFLITFYLIPTIVKIARAKSLTAEPELQNTIKQNAQGSGLNPQTTALIFVFISLMIVAIYIFYLNFESLKLQRIAKQELNAGTLTTPSEVFMNGFPFIPDINVEGEPIAVSKSRYLITEEKYQQTSLKKTTPVHTIPVRSFSSLWPI